jgi:hypothetical protein
MITIVCLVLALVWGGIWAALLQFTAWGRFIALRRAWLAVVIGVGVDLLILLILLPLETWLLIVALIGCSAVGIIARSLWNEWQELREIVEATRGDAD